MHFEDRDGERFAVMDALVSSDTGKSVEILVQSPDMEANMLKAQELGASFFDKLTFLKNYQGDFKDR